LRSPWRRRRIRRRHWRIWREVSHHLISINMDTSRRDHRNSQLRRLWMGKFSLCRHDRGGSTRSNIISKPDNFGRSWRRLSRRKRLPLLLLILPEG
jgi:hypothetical protein